MVMEALRLDIVDVRPASQHVACELPSPLELRWLAPRFMRGYSQFGKNRKCVNIPKRELNMRLLGRHLLEPLRNLDEETSGWVKGWTSEVIAATWKAPQDITKQYPTAIAEDGCYVQFKVASKMMRVRVAFCFPQGIAIIGGLQNV